MCKLGQAKRSGNELQTTRIDEPNSLQAFEMSFTLGSTNQQQTTGFGLGSNLAANKPATFGAPAPTGGSLFGNTATNQTQNAFGSTTATQPQTGGLFGNLTGNLGANTSSTGGLFGNTTSAFGGQTTTGFGQPATSSAAPTGFGTTTNTFNPGGTSGFGFGSNLGNHLATVSSTVLLPR